MLLFFAFGLAAVALARIDQKAIGAANSSGSLLPWDRFAQLWIAIFGILGAAIATATLYTPPMLRTVLGWFAPAGWFVQWLLAQTAFLVFMLLTPLLEWLAARIQSLIADAPPMEQAENVPPPEPLTVTEVVQQFTMLRYCIGGAILLIAIALLLFFFVRITQRERSNDKEETSATEGGLRPEGFRFGLDRLKEWFAMLGRYGLGNQLLAAISVENIYANLVRLARNRGYPRHPAQGPDSYLPTLMQAFPGFEAELSAITAAYLRVRYGERPISPGELEEVRAAYTAITESTSQEGGQRAAT
jgi:hypothetical protein